MVVINQYAQCCSSLPHNILYFWLLLHHLHYYCIEGYFLRRTVFRNLPIPTFQEGTFHKSPRGVSDDNFSKHFEGKIFTNGNWSVKFVKIIFLEKPNIRYSLVIVGIAYIFHLMHWIENPVLYYICCIVILLAGYQAPPTGYPQQVQKMMHYTIIRLVTFS